MQTNHPRLVIAGGGTGGHLYPALAIARALQKKAPQWDVQFVGATGGLEEKIVVRENYPLHLIPIGKLNRNVGWLARVRTVLGLPRAAWTTFCLVRKLKPDVVLGVGGFASGPFLMMASLMRVPSALWEPNAYPGLANRMLAPFVSKCLVVFNEAKKSLRGKRFVQVGLPVREAMRPAPNLVRSDQRFHVLVFGGSQGARALNEVILNMMREGGEWLQQVAVVHQTGPSDFQRVAEAYRNCSAEIEVREFLHDMNERYAWADLVICRSGASTVAELCACQKPAILVPLPSAADNHQQKNAEVLVRAGGAQMVLQKDLTAALLKSMIGDYQKHPEKLSLMSEKLAQFQFPQAAERIADELMQMVASR